MSTARRVIPNLTYNGVSAKEPLYGILKSVTYKEVASGESDSAELEVEDRDRKWMNEWMPQQGDKIAGSLDFMDWNGDGKHEILKLGTMMVDAFDESGGATTAKIKALSVPTASSFRTEERTKTWKEVTIQKILSEIAGKYGLTPIYEADEVTIKSLEQSKKTDSAFLLETVKKYGLALKVYNQKLVVYDKARYEKRNKVLTIKKTNIVDNEWDYHKDLEGFYTGAIVSYKGSNSSEKEITTTVGSTSGRTLKVNEQCDSVAEAQKLGKAKLREANEKVETFSCTIWPSAYLFASCVVVLDEKDWGKAGGRYFADEVTTKVGGKTVQKLELHKCLPT